MLILQVLFSLQTHYHLCLCLWNLFFFICQKSWFLHHGWHEHRTTHKECLPICLLWTLLYQHDSASSFHWLFKDDWLFFFSTFVLFRLHYCNSLFSGSPKHLCQTTKGPKLNFKTHLKLVNKIVYHPSSELLTGWPSKHVISCQHFVTPFSLIQPLFICLTFSVSTLYQDSSASHVTQELYALRT